MRRARLLFVDDDASIRRFVDMALETLDVDVRSCASVAEAIEALERHGPVDLLITDLMMPGQSGLDLLQRLQDEPALRGTARLAVFSAGLQGHVQADLVRYDIWRQLSKPVSAAELEACVREAMDAARLPPPPLTTANEPVPREHANSLTDSELAAARDHFAGDLRLFQDFRDGCRRQFVADLARGEASLQALDLHDVRHLAHSLKSVLLLLGHDALSDAARQLESRAASGDARRSQALWQLLATGLKTLTDEPHGR